jgi:hypothetical protein
MSVFLRLTQVLELGAGKVQHVTYVQVLCLFDRKITILKPGYQIFIL